MTRAAGRPHEVAVWALAVTAACLPLYVVRWHVGPVPTTALEVLILLTAAAYVASLWAERRLPAARTPLDIPIVLFLVAGILGIVAAPDHLRGLGIYRAYFVEAIACYYMAVDLLRTPGELRKVLLLAGAGSAALAAGQIVLVVTAIAHHAVNVDAAPAFLNTSPNSVALYLEPPLAFSTAFALYPSQPRERWLGLVGAALFLAAMILTLSRASYLAVMVLAVVALLRSPNVRWRLWTMGALAVVALLALELPLIKKRIGTLNHSVELRLSIYRQTLHMLSQRPILGAGFDGFPIRVAPFRPSDQIVELYPHDIWLTTWSEVGLLGLVSFAWIFFGLLWHGARSFARSTGLHRALLGGATGGLILYLVHGMVDSPYWKNDLSVEFWLMAAFMILGARGATEQAPAPAFEPVSAGGAQS